MEKRFFDRLAVSISASIVSGNGTYSGFIDNVSECGIGYLLTSLRHVSTDFTPAKRVLMSFQIPSGETLALDCEVKWFYRAASDGDKLTLGMEIIEPPSKYNDYIKTLFSKN